MHFIERLTAIFTYVVSLLVLSPIERPGTGEQTPLLGPNDGLVDSNHILWAPDDSLPAIQDALDQKELSIAKGPVFKPPTGRLKGPGSEFRCDYSSMSGFRYCSEPNHRGCWLTNDNGTTYNITTDYEDTNKTPIGIHRDYTLNLTDSWVNADGINFTYAKLFNNSYPGPWIQACWGDVRMMSATFL